MSETIIISGREVRIEQSAATGRWWAESSDAVINVSKRTREELLAKLPGLIAEIDDLSCQ